MFPDNKTPAGESFSRFLVIRQFVCIASGMQKECANRNPFSHPVSLTVTPLSCHPPSASLQALWHLALAR